MADPQDPSSPVEAQDTQGDAGEDASTETAVQEQAQERAEQTVTVEDIGPARKRLTITIPQSRIASQVDDSFDKLNTDAVVPGFRRGRAPSRLVRKRFGSAVRDDVRGQLMSEAYQQAITEEKLEVLGQPEFPDSEDLTLPEEGDFVFKAEVEVAPEFELPDLENIEVTRETQSVGEDDVQDEIKRLARSYGQLTDMDDAELAFEDYALCDVRILEGQDAGDDANELAHHPGAYVLVNGEAAEYRGHVVGIVVDDLGKRMEGKKVGDTISVSMTGPASHEDERIAEQPITLRISIEKIQRVVPAEIDKLVEALGVESEKELTERVTETLTGRREREGQQKMREQVTDYLLSNIEMDLPARMAGRQVVRLLQRQALDLAYRGVPEEEIERRVAELRNSSEQDAKRQLKSFFIINKAAQQLGVEVSENEVNGQIAMMAMQRGRRPEKLRQDMQRSGELENLFLQVREQKTLDLIIEKAKVTDATPEAEPAETKKPAAKTKSKSKTKSKTKAKDQAKDDADGDK